MPKTHAHNTDVWICQLRQIAAGSDEPTAEDLSTAANYPSEQARVRFFRARHLLRSILSGYAGIPGRELRFRKGRYGKLHLQHPAGGCVHFNISHSRDRLLVAVSHSGPVGVDVEHLRPIDAAWLARSWFSRAERREWARIPNARRLASFFQGWARKEAFLKATGFGMAIPLDSFSVSLDPHRAELLEIRGAPPRQWRLHKIEMGPECAAAVVTFGDPGAIRLREAR